MISSISSRQICFLERLVRRPCFDGGRRKTTRDCLQSKHHPEHRRGLGRRSTYPRDGEPLLWRSTSRIDTLEAFGLQTAATTATTASGLCFNSASIENGSVGRAAPSARSAPHFDSDEGSGLFDAAPPPAAAPVVASVTSKGDLNATFRVPGLISIPSDSEKHTVMVQNLDLTARLSWVCVPKKDTRVHLMANMLNSSAYTFIAGKANVYVDGSFIANSSLPIINPGEQFRIQLGLDQSVKTIYHPREIRAKESGFLGVGKTPTTLYSQRITVQNTKLSRVDELVIVDQLPVSEDAQITVNLKAPDLSSTSNLGAGSVSEKRASTFLGLGSVNGGDTTRHGSLVKVSDDVYAGWYTDDNHGLPTRPPIGGAATGTGKDDVGKDGKVKWVCGLGSQAKATLLLQWEVAVGSGVSVVGLHSA